MTPKLYKGGTGISYITTPGHVLMTEIEAHAASAGHVVIDYGVVAVETSPGHVVLQQVELESLRSLADCISCTVTQELNGEYELEMRYPITGVLFDELALRSVIYVKPDPTHGAQPFRVYRISKPLAGVVSVWARHISYDLAGAVVEPYSAASLSTALAGFTAHALTSMPFTFSTDKSVASTFTVREPSSVWQLLGGQAGSILDTYGGEWEFNDYNCILHSHRGSNRGVSIRYGKTW